MLSLSRLVSSRLSLSLHAARRGGTQIHQKQNNAQNKNSYRVPQRRATISPFLLLHLHLLLSHNSAVLQTLVDRSHTHASHPRVQDGDRVVREARGDLRALRVPADLKYPSLPSIRLDERAVLHVPNMQTLVKRAGGEELAIG